MFEFMQIEPPKNHTRTAKDFPKKLRQIVLNNLRSTQLSVPWLAKQLFYSERQLHRLVKQYTGKTVNGYIREMRLSRAKEILETGSFTVQQVALEVGYQKPSWFSIQFFRRYGRRPGEM